jgi:hypothetical protein
MALQAVRDLARGQVRGLNSNTNPIYRYGGGPTQTSLDSGAPGGIEHLNNIYQWYFDSVLNQLHTSLPIAPMWVCFFDIENVTSKDNCLIYAQSVHIVGDGVSTERVGMQHQGEIKGVISNGRDDIESLKVSFLETNVSFTDIKLRPILKDYTAKWGLKGDSYGPRKAGSGHLGSTLTIFQFGKSGPEHELYAKDRRDNQGKLGSPMIIRQITQYHNPRIVKIASQEINYAQDAIIRREVEFQYDYYEIKQGKILDDHGAHTFQSISSHLENKERNRTWQKNIDDIPIVGGSINNALNQTLGSLAAAGESVVSNIANTPQELANRALAMAQQRVTGVAQDIKRGINSAISDAQDRIMGGIGAQAQGQITTPHADTPEAFMRQTKSVNNEDIPVEFRSQIGPGNAYDVPGDFRHQHVRAEDNDTPTFANARQIDNGLLGEINKGTMDHPREESTKALSKDAADTPLFFGPYDYGHGLKIPQDDNPPFPLRNVNTRPPIDDNVQGKRVISQYVSPITQNKNPGNVSNPQLINIPSDNTPNSQSIPVQIVNIKK